MNKQDTFIKTRDTIDLFKDRFNANVKTRSKNMWGVILNTIKNLETDSAGNILTSNKNLKLLRTLRGNIKNTIITPAYKKDLNRFLGGFDELKGINDTYYKSIASSKLNANKQVFNEVKNFSLDATKRSLLDSGINQSIIKPVENILSQNITSGGSFQDLTESLRKDILGDSSTLGKLERYSKQVTTDSLNQFNANYNQTVSKDLGLQYYYYNGALKETSREYCVQMVNNGRYFHKKEVENSASLDWAGKIPGTNSSSIFINRGGFNCGHQWLAVDTIAVPKDVINRNIAKGNQLITVNDIENIAKKEGRGLQNQAEKVANKYKANITPLNLKSGSSIRRKILSGDSPHEIKDAFRTTIIPSKRNINAVIKEYENLPGVVARVKRQSTPMGYTGTIINTHSKSGLLGEVQVNTSKMIYAKEKYARQILGDNVYNQIKRQTGLPSGRGHTFYEEWRDIMEGKIGPTKAGIKRARQITKESQKYYSHFQD